MWIMIRLSSVSWHGSKEHSGGIGNVVGAAMGVVRLIFNHLAQPARRIVGMLNRRHAGYGLRDALDGYITDLD